MVRFCRPGYVDLDLLQKVIVKFHLSSEPFFVEVCTVGQLPKAFLLHKPLRPGVFASLGFPAGVFSGFSNTPQNLFSAVAPLRKLGDEIFYCFVGILLPNASHSTSSFSSYIHAFEDTGMVI